MALEAKQLFCKDLYDYEFNTMLTWYLLSVATSKVTPGQAQHPTVASTGWLCMQSFRFRNFFLNILVCDQWLFECLWPFYDLLSVPKHFLLSGCDVVKFPVISWA